MDAANDARRSSEHLGDEPHPRNRLPHVEDRLAERVLDGGAPERNGRHEQRPTGPDGLLQRPNDVDGASLEAHKVVERAMHHQNVAGDDTQLQQRALQIRRREWVKPSMVGPHKALQPPLHARGQHSGGDSCQTRSDRRSHFILPLSWRGRFALAPAVNVRRVA